MLVWCPHWSCVMQCTSFVFALLLIFFTSARYLKYCSPLSLFGCFPLIFSCAQISTCYFCSSPCLSSLFSTTWSNFVCTWFLWTSALTNDGPTCLLKFPPSVFHFDISRSLPFLSFNFYHFPWFSRKKFWLSNKCRAIHHLVPVTSYMALPSL